MKHVHREAERPQTGDDGAEDGQPLDLFGEQLVGQPSARPARLSAAVGVGVGARGAMTFTTGLPWFPRSAVRHAAAVPRD